MQRISDAKVQEFEKRHAQKMRELAPECMVLLKKNGDFPLEKPEKVALYGGGARRTIKGGTGSGDVNSRYYVTVEKGLEMAGFEITTKGWLDAYDQVVAKAKERFIKEIKKEARRQHTAALVLGMGAVMPEPACEIPMYGEGDTAIYVLSRISGEGNDRNPVAGDFKLTETEIRDILKCHKKYKKFLLVLNVGGAVDLSPVLEVENILLLSQLGMVTGKAFADVLLGKCSPSGKLATTWSAWEDYASIGDFGEKNDTRYKEGIYVGYRYFDSIGKKAEFPFGYGLSYTEFAVEYKDCSVQGSRAVVKAEVTNTGDVSGKEVLQLYVTAPWGRLDQPYQRLAAFAKTRELQPGEKEEVELRFLTQDLASYDEGRSAYIMEAGNYILRMGTSSAETKTCAVLKLDEELMIRSLSPVGGKTDFTDWKPAHTWKEEDLTGVPAFDLDKEALQSITWPEPAEIKESVRKFVKTLSDEELSYLCIGNHKSGPALASVIGSASQKVAGAAGESCSRVPGVEPVIMADGPAGLRLNQKYSMDEKGIHPVGESIPAGMSDYLPWIAKKVMQMGNKEPKGDVYYQHCTAIPIGTAIAQSWNLELARTCGDIVGEEMELFGIHLWLAPAFNIHRSVLCGRNFEYYSEDPMLSGRFGAAITQGVQAHPGCGTTIKHYCCNNQETTRYCSNSMVNERALREIYLKPFEICIREAAPKALMSSYNLLNGVHTSERADLNQTVLREEWGWDGLIMTDWVIAAMAGPKNKYPGASSDAAIKAGTNAFMPGNQGDYKKVLNARKGTNAHVSISREELEERAVYVVQLSKELNA